MTVMPWARTKGEMLEPPPNSPSVNAQARISAAASPAMTASASSQRAGARSAKRRTALTARGITVCGITVCGITVREGAFSRSPDKVPAAGRAEVCPTECSAKWSRPLADAALVRDSPGAQGAVAAVFRHFCPARPRGDAPGPAARRVGHGSLDYWGFAAAAKAIPPPIHPPTSGSSASRALHPVIKPVQKAFSICGAGFRLGIPGNRF